MAFSKHGYKHPIIITAVALNTFCLNTVQKTGWFFPSEPASRGPTFPTQTPTPNFKPKFIFSKKTFASPQR